MSPPRRPRRAGSGKLLPYEIAFVEGANEWTEPGSKFAFLALYFSAKAGRDIMPWFREGRPGWEALAEMRAAHGGDPAPQIATPSREKEKQIPFFTRIHRHVREAAARGKGS